MGLTIVHSRLISGGIFSNFNFNEDELIDYLKKDQIIEER